MTKPNAAVNSHNILPTVECPETPFPAQFRRRRSKVQPNRRPPLQDLPRSTKKTVNIFDRPGRKSWPNHRPRSGRRGNSALNTQTFSTADPPSHRRPERRLVELQAICAEMMLWTGRGALMLLFPVELACIPSRSRRRRRRRRLLAPRSPPAGADRKARGPCLRAAVWPARAAVSRCARRRVVRPMAPRG
jgi:hypothetical protein